MVQPRKEQVKNVLTRHSYYKVLTNQGGTYANIWDYQLNPYLISDTYGGVQEDLPANVLGTTSESYTIIAGDSFSIAIDGGIAVPIAFANTDTTTSRVAYAINTAIGGTYASNEEGYLRIKTHTSGDDSSIVLTDIVGGTLAKLGLIAGTHVGISAPVRGVVTKSADFLGGYVKIKSVNGKSIITQATSLIQVKSTADLSGAVRKVDIPGGIPIHGRIIRNPTNNGYHVNWYAAMAAEPETITFNSRFDLLDGTDIITFNFAYGTQSVGPVTVTFPGPYPYTRTSALERINEVFAGAATGMIGASNAFIIGTICQPFSFDAGGETFTIFKDGGAGAVFTLNNTHITAQQVVDKINLDTTGITASVFTLNGSNYVKITSDNTNGLVSSLWCYENTFYKLGITPGLYRGYFIADRYGNEIKIRGIGRGYDSTIVLSGANPTTFTRMGLTAGTYRGGNISEQKVTFPDVSAPKSNNGSIYCEYLIPEVLEFGEVNPASESVVERFEDEVISDNVDGAWATLSDGDIYGSAIGIPDVGKPVVINTSGQVNASVSRFINDDARRTFSKFIRGDFRSGYNTVDALVTSVIETPGTGGNPKPTSSYFIVDIDPNNTYLKNISFAVRVARDVTASFPLSIDKINYKLYGTFTGFDLAVHLDTTTLLYGDSVLNFGDLNTLVSGFDNSGQKHLPLTNSNHRYIRVLEQEANVLNPSLLGKINAVWTVTVGDGVNSFGDFNGADAIQQAIAFHVSSGSILNTIHIQCKEGTYYVSSVYGSIIAPLNAKLVIEGIGKSSSAIRNTTDATPLIISASDLYLINVYLWGRDGAYSDIQVTPTSPDYIPSLRMIDCTTRYVTIKITNTEFLATRCYFLTNYYENVTVVLADNDSLTIDQIKFVDCSLTVMVNDKPPLKIYADHDAITLLTIRKVLFDSCIIGLRSTTDSAGMLAGNCGVIDLVPSGSCYYSDTGINIEELIWKDCIVSANRGNSTTSILIHLLPVNNGHVVSDTTTEFARVGHIMIDGGKWTCPSVNSAFNPFTIMGPENITIKNATFGFNSLANFTYGSATGEVGFWATGIDTTVPPNSHWAAFAIYASNKLIIENITFQNLSRRSLTGDVFIRHYYMNINGMYMNSMYIGTGTTSTPTHRVRFRPAVSHSEVSGIVKSLHMNFGTTVTATRHATAAAIFYEPTESSVTFDNLRVSHFKAVDNSTGCIAFYLPNVNTGAYYTNSEKNIANLKIMNSYFDSNLDGIQFSTGNSQKFTNVSVLNSELANHPRTPIWIEINIGDNLDHPLLGKFEISGNHIHDNGSMSTGYVAVYVATDDWAEAGVIITNNKFYNNFNNISNTPVIWLHTHNNTSAYRLSQVPMCAVFGNMASHWIEGPPVWTGYFAGIRIDRASAGIGGFALPTPDFISNTPCFGVETGHDLASKEKRHFDNGSYTIANALRLITP